MDTLVSVQSRIGGVERRSGRRSRMTADLTEDVCVKFLVENPLVEKEGYPWFRV